MTTVKPTTESTKPVEGTEIAPTYAENVLHNAGFQFHPRSIGERLNLTRISTADIDQIVRDVDTDLLSSFLEDITFCEITEADLRPHSQETLVKLYHANQLIIEYLVDARDTLSASLNSLAEMHTSQKIDIGKLATDLAKKDGEVANLKDELYWTKMVPASSSRVDPSLYPSQEPYSVSVKKSSSLFEDSAFSLLIDRSASKKKMIAMTPPRETNGTIRLHIVSSTDAILLQMNVEGSTTIQKLQNQILSRLLIDSNVDFEMHSLYHRDRELKDTPRSLDQYHVANNDALVFMPRPKRNASSDSSALSKTTVIELKLDELTSIASKSREEIKRVIQIQQSAQESNKDAFVQEIGKHIKALEESLREEIQGRVQSVLMVANNKQDEARAYAADCETVPLTLSKVNSLNLDEMERRDDGDLEEDGIHFLQGDSLQISEILPDGEDPAHADESRGRFDVPLMIDTNAEMFTSEIEMHLPQENVKIEATKRKVDFAMLGRNSPLSTGSLDDMDKSVDLDAVNKITGVGAAHTPNRGYLLYRGINEREAPPEDSAPPSVSNRSDASLTSSEMNHTHFLAISEDFHDELDFGLDDESNGIIVNDCINNTAPNISFGMPTALDMVDDLTSVAISPNKPVEKNVPEKANVMPDGKKKNRVSFMKKIKIRVTPGKKSKPKSTMMVEI